MAPEYSIISSEISKHRLYGLSELERAITAFEFQSVVVAINIIITPGKVT